MPLHVRTSYPEAVGAIVMGSTDRFSFASATPTASDGSFEVGESWPSQGSSSWTGVSRKEVRYMELFLRGGSASEGFGRLNSGARLEISATT